MNTSRLHDYGLLFGGSLVGGLFGAAFNQLTVTLSPEYFLIAKEAGVSAMRWSAAVVGFRAALPLGATTVGVALLARSRTLVAHLRTFATAMPLAYIGVAAPLVLMAYGGHPQLPGVDILSQPAAARFRLCWALHLSAYVSCILAWIAMYARARRRGAVLS